MQQSPTSSASSVSSSTDDNKIWQNSDLDPSTISILCTLASNVKSYMDFTQALADIQKELGCSITTHGGNSSHPLIWLRIKHSSSEIRQQAKDLIDKLTNQPCDQIFLPNDDDKGGFEASKKFKPRQQVSEESSDESSKKTEESPPKSSRNLTVTFAPSQGGQAKNVKGKLTPPSSMSSSSSSSSISSSVFLNSSSSSSSAVPSVNSNFNATELAANRGSSSISPALSSPFGSILSPYNPSSISSRLKSAIQHDEEMYAESRRRNQEVSRAAEPVKGADQNNNSRRYPVDVLLQRSDVPASKKMPDNWFDPNEKYPEVCFCGKVLAYFNPNKYHDHWEKTKLRTPEMHELDPLEARLANVDLNEDFNYPTRNMESSGFDRRTSAAAFGTRKNPPNRQYKFAAAVNSLNEANISNEARRLKSHAPVAAFQSQEAGFSYVNASNHHLSVGQSSRGLKFNNVPKRYMNR